MYERKKYDSKHHPFKDIDDQKWHYHTNIIWNIKSTSNPDSYGINGTIEDSTEECFFTDSTNFCEFVYFVGLLTQQREQIYEVLAPHDCLFIPVWAIALLVLVVLVVIGIIILVIIKLLIMYFDY